MQLLARVQAEDARHGRGKLKIFFGYAAGVGKTYAMLEAARRAGGRGRATWSSATSSPTPGRRPRPCCRAWRSCPPQQVDYRGVDARGVRPRRRPARASPPCILVDELAHTNAPGCRHAKRWQDVEELLDAGIDVYTTLNVQHLESLNDVVAQITGVVVRETVPDTVFDQADEVELVDLPPDELLQRLTEGKVYVPDQAAAAMQQLLPAGQPDRPARAGPAPHGRARQRPGAGLSAATAPPSGSARPRSGCWCASAPARLPPG